jgi:hypothetical protein
METFSSQAIAFIFTPVFCFSKGDGWGWILSCRKSPSTWQCFLTFIWIPAAAMLEKCILCDLRSLRMPWRKSPSVGARVYVRPPTAKRPRQFLLVGSGILRWPLETLVPLRGNGLRKLDFQLCQFLEGELFGITRKPLGAGGLREPGFKRERTATR